MSIKPTLNRQIAESRAVNFCEHVNKLLNSSHTTEEWCYADEILEWARIERNDKLSGIRFAISFDDEGAPTLDIEGNGDYVHRVLVTADGLIDDDTVIEEIYCCFEDFLSDLEAEDSYAKEEEERKALEQMEFRLEEAERIEQEYNKALDDLESGIPGERKYENAFTFMKLWTTRSDDARVSYVVFDVEHVGSNLHSVALGFFKQEGFRSVRTLIAPLNDNGRACKFLIDEAISSFLDSL